jgi:hypothetical protein
LKSGFRRRLKAWFLPITGALERFNRLSEAENQAEANESDEQDRYCEDANSNPRCPYVTQINLHTTDLHSIKTALLGDDGTGMRGGIVFEITQLKTQDRIGSSWTSTLKPVAIAVASSAITAAITYIITH